jgi:hypothetical protein
MAWVAAQKNIQQVKPPLAGTFALGNNMAGLTVAAGNEFIATRTAIIELDTGYLSTQIV